MDGERLTVVQAGRRKAYRPLPPEARASAVRDALEAWNRRDWFETHEQLEPAWMGTADEGERLRLQAVIKLAAAFVHLARGNRAGVATNLLGALDRVADSADDGALARAIDGLYRDVFDGAPLSELRPPELRLLASGQITATGAGSGPARSAPACVPGGRTPTR